MNLYEGIDDKNLTAIQRYKKTYYKDEVNHECQKNLLKEHYYRNREEIRKKQNEKMKKMREEDPEKYEKIKEQKKAWYLKKKQEKLAISSNNIINNEKSE